MILTKDIEVDDQGEIIKNQLAYWREQLRDAPLQLEVPTDYPQTAQRFYQEAQVPFRLSCFCSEGLKNLSEQYDTSLFTTLLAAFTTLLYRYTNQNDIIVGHPVTSPKNSETRKPTSLPNNILLLRTNLAGSPSFLELLKNVREVVTDAYAHKDLPFQTLVKTLYPEIDVNRTLPYQVMMTFENNSTGTGTYISTKAALAGEAEMALADLTLILENTPQGLAGLWQYNSALFDAGMIRRMADHFHNLLNGIIANPGQAISQLPLLNTEERQRLIFEWNSTNTDYPEDKCIHELFEEQVERTPNAIAVALHKVKGQIFSGLEDKLTYRELNNRANQLGHYLQNLGVGPEVLVGICMDRSLEMMIGLLGVLKAGGAYVPLDPAYPEHRLDFMLQDARVKVLLTQVRLLEKIPAHKAQTICLDRDWHDIAQCNTENVFSGITPDNLAYVIYTSGSTGKPKGTLIIHRGVVNYLTWCIKAYRVADGSGAPVNSSIAFDATVTSFFAPLLVGKRVLLLPDKGEIDALSAALQSNSHFSLVKITPAHLDMLRYLLSDNVEGQANVLVIGGEALLRKSIQLWLTEAPGTRIINEYGPTETVVGCCTYEVPHQASLLEDVPIGRPIANTQIYILDACLQPVPVGVAGEIYIGGAGLARGYLNRPELTKERFISNPFSNDPQSRLYKTGDIARFLTDGNIIYLGRIDQQVKIRGYRIELGEIELALSQHPAVEQVVVIARGDTPGEKRLVAYLVASGDDVTNASDLRHFLNSKVPEYMVPSLFVFLKAFPLTSNGKVDRTSLPIPEGKRTEEGGDTFIAPRDVLETKLIRIFEDCLKVQPIGIQDNFF